MGGLGYFATYTLGNINAAQLFAAARQDPAIAAACEQADYAPLLAWLRQASPRPRRHARSRRPHAPGHRHAARRPAAYLAHLQHPAISNTHMRPRALLIVIEGIDGTGKSTQARRLAEWFESQGREVVLSREPTDGPWGQKLRESAATGRLSPRRNSSISSTTAASMSRKLIAPALAAGKVVILDRYYFSTMAYQGARGFDPAEIRRRNEEFAPRPDLLLILDLDVDTALAAHRPRGDTANEFEQRDSLQRCREIFLSLQHEPFARVIDSNGPPDAVAARIQQAVTAAGLVSPDKIICAFH